MSFYFAIIVPVAVLAIGLWSIIRLISPERNAVISFVATISGLLFVPFGFFLYGIFAHTLFGSLFFFSAPILTLFGIVAGIMGTRSENRIMAIVGLSLCSLILLFSGYLILSIAGMWAWRVRIKIGYLQPDYSHFSVFAAPMIIGAPLHSMKRASLFRSGSLVSYGGG